MPISYNIGLTTGIINSKNETIIAEVNQDALLELEIQEQRKEKELNAIDGKLKTNENIKKSFEYKVFFR